MAARAARGAGRPPPRRPLRSGDPPVGLSRAQPPPHLRRRLLSSSLVIHRPLDLPSGLFPLLYSSFNSFLPNWPPPAFLPADSLVLRLLKNPNQTVFSLEFEGRVSLAVFFFSFSLYIQKPRSIDV